MHIAICDDIIADRKQTERLFTREADKRKDSIGAIYIDSYGNVSSLLGAPMLYDLFIIDYHSENEDSCYIANTLREAGVIAPIFLAGRDEAQLQQEIDSLSLEHIYPLLKPFRTADVEYATDTAHEIMSLSRPLIELRGMDETYYLNEDEIMYIHCIDKQVEVHRSNSDTDYIVGIFDEVYHSFEENELFISIGKHYIINARYIDKVSFSKVVIKNGDTILVSPFTSSIIKKTLIELREDNLIP